MQQDTGHQFTSPESSSSETSTLGQTFFPLNPSHTANPYAFYAHARREDPIFFSTFLNAWIVTRYDDVITILKDHQHFASAVIETGMEKIIPEAMALLATSPLMQAPLMASFDPPEHTRLRSGLTKAFSAQRIASLEPQIRTFVNRLIDHVASWGQMDFMEHFAMSYPILVIGSLLNVPEADMDQIIYWSADLITLLYSAPPPEQQLAYAQHGVALLDYIYALAEERRKMPQDDLISDLYRAMETGEALLTPLEVAGMLYLLLLAGFETVAKFLGTCLLHLLSDRKHWEAIVADPSCISLFVEEALRFDSPALATMRIANEAVTIRGKSIEKGDRIQVILSSANHDEALFSDSEMFHPFQESSSRHIAFGYGIHFCIGAPLARLESRVALEQLCLRLPSLRLAPDQEISYEPSLIMRSLKQLQVEWDL